MIAGRPGNLISRHGCLAAEYMKCMSRNSSYRTDTRGNCAIVQGRVTSGIVGFVGHQIRYYRIIIDGSYYRGRRALGVVVNRYHSIVTRCKSGISDACSIGVAKIRCTDVAIVPKESKTGCGTCYTSA